MATSTGGYDYKFVRSPPKHLECSICLWIVCDPCVTSCCGNHFCRLCIDRIRREHSPCPLCKERFFTTFLHKGVAREVNALKVYCPHKSQGCDWQGELGQVEKHLNPEDKSWQMGCGFVMVECKYMCGGSFQRCLVKKHEAENCCKRPQSNMTDVSVLVSKLSTDIQEMLKHQEDSNLEVSDLRHEVAMLRIEVSVLQAKNKSLMQQIKVRPLPPVPPFYFSITNYDKLYKDSDSVFFSPPFYSQFGGYKLRLEVHPNGNYTGYNTHLSLYPCVMIGEYDDELQWPFHLQVFVEMYNYTLTKWTKMNCINDFVAGRPVECDSMTGHGIHRFLPIYRLTEDYLSSDSTIRFCVVTVLNRSQ